MNVVDVKFDFNDESCTHARNNGAFQYKLKPINYKKRRIFSKKQQNLLIEYLNKCTEII